MEKYLDKTLVHRDKSLMITSSTTLFCILLMLMNNVKMFKTIPLNKSPLRQVLVQQYFSMSFIAFLILYLCYSVLVILFFKDKQKDIAEIEDGQYTKKQYFFTKTVCILVTIIIPIILNVIMKFIAYGKQNNVFQNRYNIDKSIILIFLAFQIVLALCSLGTLIMSQMLFKDLLEAAIFPLLFVEFIFTTFGINSLMISNQMTFIKEIINPIKYNVVDKLIDIIYWNGRVELQPPEIQWGLIIAALIVSLILLALSYLILGHNIKNKKQLKYSFRWIGIIYHIILAIMIGIYIPAVIAYYIAFTNPNVTLEYATYKFNVIALIITPIIFIFIFEKPIWKFCKKQKLQE